MENIRKTPFLILALFVLACNQKNKAVSEKLEEKHPNVLIIYPDQLRRYSAGFWSEDRYKSFVQGEPDPVVTPTMDRLAKNGTVMTNAISNFPLCSPARGMLLTGLYPEQNGIWNNCKKGRKESLKDDVSTFTDIFFNAGYNTAYFGKCHWLQNTPLFSEKGDYTGSPIGQGGHYLTNYDTYIPPGKSRHNIEYFYQSVRDHHFDPLVFSNDSHAIEGKKDGELHRPKVFSPKNEAQKIIAYLRNENTVRDTQKPFFMIWSINPPHNPWDDWNTDMDVLEKYYDKDKYPNIDSLLMRKNVNHEVGHYARHYYANVTSMDFYIGQVIDELEAMGELDNTLVILSSDHGEMLGSHGRTGKNTFETEAIAVPMIIHWPKRIKKAAVSDILFSMADILPTTLGLLEMDVLEPNMASGLDFSSIPQLLDKKDCQVEPKGILLMLNKGRGVLTKEYTLCVREKQLKQSAENALETFIYDNVNDPYQLRKIAIKDRPKISKELIRILVNELKRTNDPWYQENKIKHLMSYYSP